MHVSFSNSLSSLSDTTTYSLITTYRSFMCLLVLSPIKFFEAYKVDQAFHKICLFMQWMQELSILKWSIVINMNRYADRVTKYLAAALEEKNILFKFYDQWINRECKAFASVEACHLWRVGQISHHLQSFISQAQSLPYMEHWGKQPVAQQNLRCAVL